MPKLKINIIIKGTTIGKRRLYSGFLSPFFLALIYRRFLNYIIAVISKNAKLIEIYNFLKINRGLD